MKPKELWLFREEYQEFPINEFRGHIYQEVRSELETPYWLVKKQKKADKLAKRKTMYDDKLDFFDGLLI